MKCLTFPLLSFIVFLASGCGNDPEQDQFEDGQYGYIDQYSENPEMQDRNGNLSDRGAGGEKLIMHPVMDPKTGMVSQHLPLPASWKIAQNAQGDVPAITGPGGVKVYYRSGGTFSYSSDAYMQQTYQMAGQSMRQPMEIGAYIQQDLVPALGNNGMRLVKQYPLPQIAASNGAYIAKLYKALPSRDHCSAMGTDWVNAKGEPMFIIVNMMVSQGQSNVFWYTNMQVLAAEKGAMASAKAALINSIVNTRYNPQQIAAYNAAEQQKSSQSWSQHNARMQENQRNFDQRQAIHRSTTEAVNNSIMDGYNSRQRASDENQRGFLNYINDENTVRDNNTGERYQVQSGADQYWMNNNQEYIQSNDAFYDPNADQNVNNQQWQEVEVEP